MPGALRERDLAPRRRKPLEELAAEQGVKPFTENDERIGAGHDLWESDEEFEEFLKWLRQSRREGR